MKVLVVCQYFYPEQFKVNDICFELANMGHEVTVLTGLPNYPSGIISREYKWLKKPSEIINNVKIIRTPILARGKGSIRLALNYASYAISATIRAMFVKKDFDIILVYQLSPVFMSLPAILLKKVTGKPLLLYCHDLWPESIIPYGISQDSLIYKMTLKLSKWMYHSADKILLSSNLFKLYFNNVIDKHVNLQYLPVYAESIFENITSKPKDNVIDLVFAGNIGEMQSVETIVHAANVLKDNKDIKWHIVGDGSAKKRCEQMAEAFGLDNIVFYGHRPITEMPDFYSIADAFLVTLKANELISYTLPNKVQSYMATGKPIIGSIDGETRTIIEEAGCGLCCAAEDHNALADLVIKFSQSKDTHSIYGENARNYYNEHFSKQAFFTKFKQLLKSALGEESKYV